MNAYNIDTPAFDELKDKVVVLTGGATGIGAALVGLLHSHGARVVFGDINESDAEALRNSLSRFDNAGPVDFVKTDVTQYNDILALFDTAYKKYGRVDAAIVEIPGWFDARLTLETIKEVPSTKTLDISLLGTLYFARIACVYLSQDITKPVSPSQQNPDKSLVLISSVLGFKALPGSNLYQSAKHGILGLLRGLRLQLPKTHGIRVNAVCPSHTNTQMVARVTDAWLKAGSMMNEAVDVANVIASLFIDKERINGEAIYVAGGKGWRIEQGIQETQPLWMGEEPSEDIEKASARFGAVFQGWNKNKQQ
ncbi:hypothetical protein H072_10006 [Dactylellina haptotyla CBS 200.50]|uniref:3-hydroxyacyl-CoA dehydrogenase n=1 Tax=Dactylellina haptotyla (strain CBS 200.50) TaxID=1284197 RepID=S8BBF2_DACHA|nr:hypothetical protein H072_10006 [Dactylellina haptotyla CBS 200.50]